MVGYFYGSEIGYAGNWIGDHNNGANINRGNFVLMQGFQLVVIEQLRGVLMNIKQFIIMTSAVLLIFLISCSEVVTSTIQVPPIPTEVSALPVGAKMRCTGDRLIDEKTIINIFEFPGLDPPDDSSNASIRGKTMGKLSACTDINILEKQWSSSDQEYYVQIIESESGIEGWVTLSMITFNN